MHKYFAEWYRVAGVDPKGDDLPKRWSGVEAMVSTMNTGAEALDVARVFLGLTPVNANFKEEQALLFQKADPAFPMRNNDLELRVLAGAASAQYVETKRTHVGDALALAVITGACPSLRSPVLVPDIVTIVKKYLFDEGLLVRKYARSPEIKGMELKTDQLVADVKAATSFEALSAPLQKLHSGVDALSQAGNKAVTHLDGLVAALAEQANVLWWVFAGTSRDLGRPYSELPLQVACLCAGKELAELTEILPGPVSAPAVLDKILSLGRAAAEQVNFGSAIDKVDLQWRQKCLDGTEARLDDLSPVHRALRASATDPMKASTLSAVDFATQIYNEKLLQKAARA